MYAEYPKLAKEFESKTPKGKKLPARIKIKNKRSVTIHGY